MAAVGVIVAAGAAGCGLLALTIGPAMMVAPVGLSGIAGASAAGNCPTDPGLMDLLPLGDRVMPLPKGTWSWSAGYNQPGSLWSSGFHTGQDFSAPAGTPVLAIADATVVGTPTGSWHGNMVQLRHGDGSQTWYAHLSAFTTETGAQVQAGQQIGRVGSTGNSTGPHLHLELRDPNGALKDPKPWLEGAAEHPGGGQARRAAPTPAPTTGSTVTDGQQVTIKTFGDWARVFLAGLSMPQTDANVLAVAGWAGAEGFADGKAGGRHNPLNTTQPMPGAANYNPGGVKNYPDWQTGLDASLKTITNGLYQVILTALKPGTDAAAVFRAIQSTPWGTRNMTDPNNFRSWVNKPLPFGGGTVTVNGATVSLPDGPGQVDCPNGETGADLPPPGSLGPYTDGTGPMRTVGVSRTPEQAARILVSWVGRGGYSGLCLKLADDAYQPTGPRTGTAIAQWERAKRAGFAHPGDRNPSVGAQLFWWSNVPARHVATYVGGGMVVTNMTSEGGIVRMVPAEQLDTWGPYLGWAEPYYR